MEKTDKITERQLAVLAFAGLLSPLIRTLPRLAVTLAGYTAWLSPVIASAAAVLYYLFIRRLFKKRRRGEGLSELAIRVLGRVGGRIFCAVCGVWLVLYTGFVLRSAAERLLSSVYEEGNTVIFIFIMIIAAVLAGAGCTKYLARTAEVFAPIITGVIALVILFSLTEVKTEYLFPVTYEDAGNIALGAVPMVNIVGGYAYFMFLAGHVEERPGGRRAGIAWVLVQMLIILGIMVVTIGSASAPLIRRLQNPFFMIIRNTTIFGIIERIEALIVAIWVITDFIYIASELMITGEIWLSVFGRGKRRTYVYISAVIAAAFAFFISKNAFDLRALSETVTPVINMAIAFVFVPILFITGLLRRRI